jgi:hypothetical protein
MGVTEMTKANPHIVRCFAAAGFLIPCVLSLVIFVGDIKIQGVWDWILLVPWPTAALLMSAEGGGAVGRVIAFALSVGANMALYSCVAWVVSFCYRRFASPAPG